ncbi:MAG: phytanoyl-CoA dioxygenase family protein [Alphaproteobacteria bacterium]|nr:phytanoyl-CoA dioxygenase family protein [Alphaproteobacteria bacterium]
MVLPDKELAAFRRDGFALAPPLVSAADIEAVRGEIAAMVAALPNGHRPENLRDPHEACPRFLALCLDSPIARGAELLLGPNLLMWGSYGFAKPPRDGLPVDWHQDGRYFPLEPMETVTAWLPLDDADEGNGGLRVIPGSHRPRRFLAHATHEDWGRARALPLGIEDADEARARTLAVKAGAVEYHDPYLVHGSGPNRSNRPRRAIQILYMTRRVRLDTSDKQAMGLDWHRLKLFHCRPRMAGGWAYHLADAPDEVCVFGA